MLPVKIAGNTSGEATPPSGNIFNEPTRGALSKFPALAIRPAVASSFFCIPTISGAILIHTKLKGSCLFAIRKKSVTGPSPYFRTCMGTSGICLNPPASRVVLGMFL
jgi:hypothetical protein